MHQQQQNPSREESHQGRVLSKGQFQKAHNREDPRNRVRALLGRVQSQVKDPLVRDLGKARDHQARGPKQVKVLLARDPLVKDPGKVRDHQARGPNQVKALLARDPLVKDPGKVRDHLVKGQNQVKVLLVKDPVGRPPGKVKGHQAKAPQGNRHPDQTRLDLPSKKAAHHNKDLEKLDPNSKGHKALGLILGSQEKVLDLQVSWVLESLQVYSVHCVKPPS